MERVKNHFFNTIIKRAFGISQRNAFSICHKEGISFGLFSQEFILSRYEENVRWLSGYYDRLKMKYRDEWVAVLNKAVADHDRELARLVERLRKKYPNAYSEIAVEYVTSREIELLRVKY